MIERDRDGKKIFESFDGLAVLLSESQLPYWLRAPERPALLRQVSFGTRHRDPVTLDLFTGEPKK